ncbi:hypothetical protein [Streptomyces asiaticus]|uniref:hypothetical protein n=1 Tax=Streptomyces asiaticus TaxID=114695 RepID=UPI001BA58991|nr:hypothetical protein [Streptomyces asiaticus]
MNAPLIILLAGGRNLPEPGIVPGTLADIALNITDGPIIVRHGACPGPNSADQAASDWIRDCGGRLDVTEDPMAADWDNCGPDCPPGTVHRRRKKPGDIFHPGSLDDYCPGAGPRRNADMAAKLPRADWMLAFPDPTGPSYGTRNCMRLAKQAGIPVHEVTA